MIVLLNKLLVIEVLVEFSEVEAEFETFDCAKVIINLLGGLANSNETFSTYKCSCG